MKKIYLISALPKETVADSENVVYKIGVTKQSSDKRLKQLQTGTDKKLTVVKEFKSDLAFKIEKNLHLYFNSKRENREWFKLEPEDVDKFISLCEKYEKSLKYVYDNNTYI